MSSETQSQKSFSLLVAAAFADGGVTDNEMSVLHRKATELRIPMARLDELLDQARRGQLRLTYPSTPAEREKRLDDILDVITADGRIEAPERQFMMRYASVLGGMPGDLNERIQGRMKRAARRNESARTADQIQVSRMDNTAAEIHAPPPAAPNAVPTAPAGTPSAEPAASGPTHAFGEASSTIKDHSDAAVFNRPPGPVQFDAPTLLGTMHDLPPITLALVKQVIEFEGVEEAAGYLQRACLMEAGPAREMVERVVRTHPDLKPRSRQVRHGRR